MTPTTSTMKRGQPFINLLVIIALLLPNLLINVRSVSAAVQVTIDWNNARQEIDGIGASFANNAQWLQSFPEPGRSKVLNLLFSQTEGAGLSLIRHILSCRLVADNPDWATIEPSEGVWDWSRDQGQKWLLNEAKNRGTTRFFSTILSPPAWMKTNNSCLNGGSLRADKQQAYADYLSRFIREYKAQFNLDMYAISLANEPQTPRTYQSAIWTDTQFRDFINGYLKPTFARDGVTAKVIITEQERWGEELAAAALNDANASSGLQIIAAHNYNVSGNDPMTGLPQPAVHYLSNAKSKNKRVWQTEVSTVSADNSSINDALRWARNIHDHMATSESNAWVWWQGVLASSSGFDFNSGQGLIYLNNANNTYSVRKRLYTIGNFSRFIRPGYVRVQTSSSEPIPGQVFVSAYKDPVSRRLVVVAINTTTSNQDVNFTLANAKMRTATSYITSNSYNLRLSAHIPVAANGLFSSTLPPQSVTTFVGLTTQSALNTPSSLPVMDSLDQAALAVTSQGPGKLDLFMRSNDNTIWRRFFDGGWSDWIPMYAPPGGAASAPAATSRVPGGLDVFVRGADNNIWINWYNDGWSGWQSLQAPPGGATSAPAVTRVGANKMILFVRGADNATWKREWTNGPGWSAWTSFGAYFTSSPAAATAGYSSPSQVITVARGGDNAIWIDWLNIGSPSWSGWSSLGGGATSAPAASTRGDPMVQENLFVRGGNNAIWINWKNGSGTWNGWYTLGGAFLSGPAAVSWETDRIDVFGIGGDNKIYNDWWTSDTGWSNWIRID